MPVSVMVGQCEAAVTATAAACEVSVATDREEVYVTVLAVARPAAVMATTM